jgi:tetratricopeptide (TPR) repeat protein
MHVNFGRAGALIAAIALLGCAGPQAAGQGAAAAAIPAAEALHSYPLVKDEPSIVSATHKLGRARDTARPPSLLARATAAIAAAQRIRTAEGTPFSLPATSPDYEPYLAYYDLAYRDLQELVVRHPKASEAPEAEYLLGLIHDYPHLDLFDEALVHYRRALETYPGTPWAQKAADRLALIEGFMRGATEPPHGNGQEKRQ